MHINMFKMKEKVRNISGFVTGMYYDVIKINGGTNRLTTYRTNSRRTPQ